MKNEILNAAKGSVMTHPQGGLLFKLTGLKFWSPETLPQPTLDQASILIAGMIAWNKKERSFTHKDKELDNSDMLEVIQMWFPSVDDMRKVRPMFFKKKQSNQGNDHEEEPQPETKPETKSEKPHTSGSGHHKTGTSGGHTAPEPKEEKPFTPEPKPQEKPSKPKSETTSTPEPETKGTETIIKIINCGIRNIWMVGPAGCGKTTICKAAGDELELPVTVIPCGAGTSSTTFLGYKYPEREGTPFVGAFAQPGIIVLDEFTALEAQVAQVANAALANNELVSTSGTIQRHPDCIIICTSNTFGHGADRMYVSNNQLDASTTDRFAGTIIEIDYSKEYESQYDAEVVKYVWHIRDIIARNGLRKIASTRLIINGCLLKAGGMNWKEMLTTNWSKDEKALL